MHINFMMPKFDVEQNKYNINMQSAARTADPVVNYSV